MAATHPTHRTPSDAELREYQQLVVGVVARRFRTLDRDDVEDCCQQAFLETWPKRAEYNGAYPNLLVTTALRRASDHYRRYQTRNAIVDHQEHAAFAVAGDEPDPAAVAQREVELRRGAELLSMLPPHHQRIWRAYCDAGARHNAAAIAAIAEAEGLKPRQVTKVIDKVKEKARRIAAQSLTPDLEIDAAYCARLEDTIERHLDGREPSELAERHLEDCARCRALFHRTRGIERAAAALLPPLPILHELELFGATASAATTTTSVVTTAKAWVAAGVVAVGGGGGAAAVVATRDAPPPSPKVELVAPAPSAVAPPGAGGRAVADEPAPPKRPQTAKRRRVAEPTKAPRTTSAPEPEASTPAAPPAPTQREPAAPEPKAAPPAGDEGEFGIE
jgi:RNA polymerase sigma factor (sigma-70 family)